MPPIYLDNAASTRVSDEVLALVSEVTRTAWGNPSSQHPQGAAARAQLATARTRVLTAMGDAAGSSGDVVWTSGCSEANALAVLGAARARAGKIVMSALDHPALATLGDQLARDGREVERVAPGRDGVVDPDALARAAAGAAVVALTAVQNEVGLVQPIAAIVQALRAAGVTAHVHVDATQALGKIALDAPALAADSLAVSGHKLHGPKGIGALVLRAGAAIEPLWLGGGQQRGLRGGTIDPAAVAGLGLAAERAVAALPTARARWLELGTCVTQLLERRGVAFRQLVPDHRRAPHILALAIPGVPGDAMRNVLASRGVYVSTGSACSEGSTARSPALVALGVPEDHGVVRLSFGLDTLLDEVDMAAGIIADVAGELRKR